jgi:hypothetical protein
MQIRTVMAIFLATSLGALATGCQQRSDDGTAQPQSRTDTPMMQGKVPAAPTQGSDSTTGKDTSSTAAAPSQPSDTGTNAMASPYGDRTKTDDAATQKGSS